MGRFTHLIRVQRRQPARAPKVGSRCGGGRGAGLGLCRAAGRHLTPRADRPRVPRRQPCCGHEPCVLCTPRPAPRPHALATAPTGHGIRPEVTGAPVRKVPARSCPARFLSPLGPRVRQLQGTYVGSPIRHNLGQTRMCGCLVGGANPGAGRSGHRERALCGWSPLRTADGFVS